MSKLAHTDCKLLRCNKWNLPSQRCVRNLFWNTEYKILYTTIDEYNYFVSFFLWHLIWPPGNPFPCPHSLNVLMHNHVLLGGNYKPNANMDITHSNNTIPEAKSLDPRDTIIHHEENTVNRVENLIPHLGVITHNSLQTFWTTPLGTV